MRAAIALLLFLSFSACAAYRPTSLYRWGEYEQLIYEMYLRPGEAGPDAQVARLSEDIERSIAEGYRVPPGVRAHLGYMFYLQGNVAQAKQYLHAEKERFPESTVFVDGMLKRLEERQ